MTFVHQLCKKSAKSMMLFKTSSYRSFKTPSCKEANKKSVFIFQFPFAGERFSDVVGSPYYVAPEVLCKRYGPEADVWSVGVILYILLSGVPPFWAESEQGLFEEVLHGDLDFSTDPWPSISKGAKDLVRKMLIRDPKRRISAHDVLCHPWVQVGGVAPDKPLDSAILSRLKQFSAMNKLKKMAIRVIAESLSEEEIAGLKEMFKMIDIDSSGQITFEELKAGLKRFGANLKESEIYDLMQVADVDNSGTIDYGEFVAATLHLNKIEREDHLFAALHLNKIPLALLLERVVNFSVIIGNKVLISFILRIFFYIFLQDFLERSRFYSKKKLKCWPKV
ncbi:calcium-dependent protein kinase 1-like [Humulus lupulus]|uniref:calcium-dependent protein kinase 1-like n=1 Tax=Humulus lupulus TaxID=3486 RepID=UPI002B402193|nr:calcium-dependent protein kinase 1-like [Humulus lupulus]